MSTNSTTTVGSIEKTCYFWKKTGQCKHGARCNFLHIDTPVLADPPRTWIDYGDKGPPKAPPKVKSNAGDSSEDGKSREKAVRPNIIEEEWEDHVPAGQWDHKSSSAGNNWHETRPSGVDAAWETQASANVTEWFPKKANGTRSVAESTTASNRPATPTQQRDYTESPVAIGDLWETLLPPDFAQYRELRKRYPITVDPEFDVDALVMLLSAEPLQLLDVDQYLSGYSDRDLDLDRASSYEKIPPVFFAVATNEPRALKLLIDRSVSVNATAGPNNIPLLAFAIMHGSRADTTEMVRILLASGADPTEIPDDLIFLDKYSNNHTFSRPSTNSAPSWLSERYRIKLASTINISQRYWLSKARVLRPRTEREHLIARMERCPNLFQMPFCVVGQNFATGLLIRRILSHLLLSKSNPRPLVVTFVGPSGHGKTELAKSMQTLLSAELLAIDCAGITSVTDLFGPKAPSPGYEQGSTLNNFLCRNHGQRSIVLLDEFEKMGPAVHESLLIPFDEGVHRDRRGVRNDTDIDCSRVIWILTTSKVDNIIEPYYKANAEVFLNPNTQDYQLLAGVINQIESKFLRKFSIQFGTTFAGRISMVLPFLPFSPSEQSVIAHKYLLKLKRTLAADVSKDIIMGHIELEVEGETAVCRHLAENGYEIEYGARSIEREIQRSVHDAITQEWLGCTDWILNQKNSSPYERYRLSFDPSKEQVVIRKIVGKKDRARVRQNGTVRRPGGHAGSYFESSAGARSGTPSSAGGMKSLKVGRLIDIEMVRGEWED